MNWDTLHIWLEKWIEILVSSAKYFILISSCTNYSSNNEFCYILCNYYLFNALNICFKVKQYTSLSKNFFWGTSILISNGRYLINNLIVPLLYNFHCSEKILVDYVCSYPVELTRSNPKNVSSSRQINLRGNLFA